MEKKLYNSPLTEVAKVNMSGIILGVSPSGDDVPPIPPHPGSAPKRPDLF